MDTHKCEYQAGDFERAVGGIPWLDADGRCNLEPKMQFDGKTYCVGHAVIAAMDEGLL
jgi:hypothetical protein